MPSFQMSYIPYLILLSYYFSNIIISDTVFNHEYITDLNELLTDAKDHHDMAIYGNPLLTQQCRNALLHEHKYNLNNSILNLKGFPSPWFWSRESLDGTIRDQPLHRRLKITHALQPEFTIPWSSSISNHYAYAYKRLPSHIVRWYDRLGHQTHTGNTYKDDYDTSDQKLSKMNDNNYRLSLPDNVMYYHIEKSGSSSIAGMLHVYNFNTSYTSENALFHCQCGFTFVRDPISRFVSGYYTINKLIYWFHHHLPRIGKKGANMDKVPRLFSFWNITGEPQRMMEFVNNIYDSSFEFTKITPLEHMMTQSGLLGVSSADIHYIGRVSDLMEHLDVIKNKCAIRTDNKFLLETDLIEQRIMTRFGTKWFDELRPWYTDMLSLDDYVKGDLDPAYLA
eukprot:29894_1